MKHKATCEHDRCIKKPEGIDLHLGQIISILFNRNRAHLVIENEMEFYATIGVRTNEGDWWKYPILLKKHSCAWKCDKAFEAFDLLVVIRDDSLSPDEVFTQVRQRTMAAINRDLARARARL